MVILQLQGVTRYFGGLAAVYDVSFDVYQGEILGLIGPNGAGKSTLFSLIAGSLAPTRGVIRFRGQDIAGLPSYRVVRLGICRTHQIPRPFRDLSVRENVAVAWRFGRMGRHSSGRDGRHPASDVEQVLEFTGLREHAQVPAGHLPVGLLKRLELARALATGPEVVLADEVCAGLNPAETREVLQLLSRLRQSGLTVIYVEHDMRAIMGVCDRIVVLNHGQKLAEGTPREIQENEQVVEAYLGRRTPGGARR